LVGSFGFLTLKQLTETKNLNKMRIFNYGNHDTNND